MNAKIHTLLFVLLLIFAPFARSQTQDDTVTLKGVVSETTLLSNNDLHVWLQNDRIGSEVCLGPSSFLEDHGFLPGVGDSIEITGARVRNGSLLAANSLQMGGKTLKLSGDSRTSRCPGCCDGQNCGHDCGGCNCGTYQHHRNRHHGYHCGHE